jgi:O-antigen/teichoic acid export membrane protein
VLSFFGGSYAQEATWCLRFLALAVFPLIIRTHYVAISRIFKRVGRAAIIISICAVFELLLSASGARAGGLTGLSLGWLVAICLEALLMSVTVFRVAALREPKAPSSFLDVKVASHVNEDAALLDRETNKH